MRRLPEFPEELIDGKVSNLADLAEASNWGDVLERFRFTGGAGFGLTTVDADSLPPALVGLKCMRELLEPGLLTFDVSHPSRFPAPLSKGVLDVFGLLFGIPRSNFGFPDCFGGKTLGSLGAFGGLRIS